MNEGEIYFIRSQNIHNNKLITDNISFIPENIYNDMKRTWVEYEDVLLNITGASIGRATFYPFKDRRANVNQHVCIIRTIKEKLSPKYLTFFLISARTYNKIMGTQQGVTREALNYTQIKNMDITFPEEIKEQEQIVNRLNTVYKTVRNTLEEQKNIEFQLEQLPKAVLAKAFKGELV